MNAPVTRKPVDRLRHASERYAVAVECFEEAARCGCSGDVYDALWAIVDRESKTATDLTLVRG